MRQCEQTLAYVPTDWGEVYLRLKASFMGSDFTPHRFLRTPITTLQAVLSYVEEYEELVHNIESSSTAQLTHYVLQIDHAHRHAGDPTPPPLNTKPGMFLPFPKRAGSGDEIRLKQKTIDILLELFKTRQIPIHVYSRLMHPPNTKG